ncbi:MAG TPA: DUF3782 domain-containing protein [Desulfobacteraceae bacterium]|nr:DUF3782 domain-containing protein [Desulfobacteraceae bacterium]
METQNIEEVKRVILTQLPRLMETEPEIRDFILRVTREQYAGKQETESRFDRIMDELRRDREADMRKWEAQEQRWAAWDKKWEEERQTQEKKWEAQESKWEAQEKKWEDNQKVINEMLAEIRLQNQKYDSTIGALGARWGLHSESAFRNGLKAILEKSFGVKVERYEDYDHEGRVFGRPEQIEMDVIIHDGTLILCEIKSSMSKSDLYAFWRKKNFYEEKHGRRASRAMVISPMIDDYARSAAKELDIEVYGYAEDVKT